MGNNCIVVHGLEIAIERKRVKNINLAVYPPDGRVRVSAPIGCSSEMISSVIKSKLPWILKQRTVMRDRTYMPSPRLKTGEKVMVFGREFSLVVNERVGAAAMRLVDEKLELTVRPGTPSVKRITVLNDWYRKQLQKRVPELLSLWQPVIGVEVKDWRIRRMKTRWGSCNIRDKRVWLNLALVRLSPVFLEYVLVHEMVHLLERYHNGRFWHFMDRFLPQWRQVRKQLQQVSIGPQS